MFCRFSKKDESYTGTNGGGIVSNLHTPKGALGVQSGGNAVDTATGEEEVGDGDMSIVDCMVRGSTNVVESISNPNAHRKAAQSKFASGGKLTGQNRKK